jgi:membrane fusion protein, multidrug efflux system
MQDHDTPHDHASLEDAQAQPGSSRLRWLGAVAGIAIVGVIVWHIVAQPSKKQHASAQVVSVAQATRGDMDVTLDEIGTVTPSATVTVLPNASVSGYLTKVLFKEGQMVAKGQLLAEIDPRPYQVLKAQAEAALAKDQALLDQARYDFALYKDLNEKKAIAGQTFGDQKYTVAQEMAAVAADKASIAQYALDITYCHIVSPTAGRAGLRLVDEGNYITGSSSSGIVTITTMNPMLVQFGVAQNDIARVAARFNAPGVKLPVTAFDSSTHQPLATGSLYAVSNQMTSATGQTAMRATFANDNSALWPNAFVNVRMLVDTVHNATLVPTPSVLTGAPGTYVYVANKDMTVSIRKITTGASDGTHTVVLSGLNPGETVVTDGTDRLNDGAKIRVNDGKPRADTGDGAAGGTKSGKHHHGAKSGSTDA